MATCERLDLVMVGHVDHGKSTVVGRLLAETGSLPEGRLEQVQAFCRSRSRRLEYAYLLDALGDERAQGITIDGARIRFRSPRREYALIDAPGHVEFLRNMVTGASRAEAALLVVDAAEGVQENSRRHASLLPLMGVSRVLVLVNKMDLVGYRRDAFHRLREEFTRFLATLGVEPAAFLPVSGLEGDNLATPSPSMPWYRGDTVLQALDRLERPPSPEHGPFRMFVQDVYRFTRFADSRRLVAGTVDSGTLQPGDEIVFHPSGKRTRVKTLERFNAPPALQAGPGEAVSLTVSPQVYVTRGELATRAGDPPPPVATRLRASLFWLAREPLRAGRAHPLKLGTARAQAWLEGVERVVDAGTFASRKADEVGPHQVAECTLRLHRPLAFDETCPATSRFVLLDGHRIVGGGVVRQALPASGGTARAVSPAERAERFGHGPGLVVIAGGGDTVGLAHALERRLFMEGRQVYCLAPDRDLPEAARTLLDAGLLVIAPRAEARPEVPAGPVGRILWYGGTPAPFGHPLPEEGGVEAAVDRALAVLGL